MKVLTFPAVLLVMISVLFGSTGAHAQPAVRGGNIDGMAFDADTDLAVLRRMKLKGANTIRLFFYDYDASTHDESEARDFLEDHIYPRMSEIVDLLANEEGVKVIISILIPPGGRVNAPGPVDRALIPGDETEWMRSVLVDAWSHIAAEFNSLGDKVAYQIYSEPAPPSDKSAWISLQKRIIDAIRDADSTPVDQQPVVYYMTEFGTPSKFASVNLAARRGRMGLAFGAYHPHDYTHQGIDDSPKRFKYPGCGVVGGKAPKKTSSKFKACTASGVEDSMKQFSRFANKNNLVKLAAEMSVSRFAPNAARFLTDEIRALKAQKIGWLYYAFNERGNSPWRLDCTDASGSECIPVGDGPVSSRQAAVEKGLGNLSSSKK